MVIATGFFDGVHLGHRQVLSRLVETARRRGEESQVITFWPHPRNVLQDDARNLRLLNSLEEKKAILKSLGVDRVEVVRFTKEFSRLSTEQYLERYVRQRYGGTAVVLGYDNRVGRGCDSAEKVAEAARSLGIEALIVDKVDGAGDAAISSTRIRTALSAGDVATAEQMLGYAYGLHGVVVAGNRLGRTIGFPTANMQLYEPLKLVPANGVYLVEVETLGGQWYGMCNIGVKPTVSTGNTRTIETNIFDFDEDIYGLDLRLRFLSRVRDEMKFDSLECLRAQLEADERLCRDMIADKLNDKSHG